MLAAAIASGFSQIDAALLRLRTGRGPEHMLNLSVPPTFCSHWLIPRLPNFYADHPGITLNLSTRVGVPDAAAMHEASSHCAIAVCSDSPAGLDSKTVLPLTLYPCASPALLARAGSNHQASEYSWRRLLSSLPLLDQLSLPEAWPQFLNAHAMADAPVQWAGRYELLSLGHHAALAGLGIALLPDYVITNDLRSRRLKRLGRNVSYRSEKAYRLIYPPGGAPHRAFDAFNAWLGDQSSRST